MKTLKKKIKKIRVFFARKVKKLIIKYLELTDDKKPIQKNLIVFESFFGRNINDNPEAIYSWLDKEKYECVFIVNKPSKFEGYNVVRRNSLEAYKYLRRAKIIISNSRMPALDHKKEGQIYLQTWHGTPLKKLVYDLNVFDMPSAESLEEYLSLFSSDVNNWDYLISSCSFTSEKFKSAFHFEKEILEIGYPRNQKLYDYTDEDVVRIKEELEIPLDKKVMLYAPTYRDNLNFGTGKYYFNSPLDFELLQKEFPEYLILIRYHYIITNSDDFDNENIINVSKYQDISDLYLISDLLITDYSSVFFDYSLLKKPFLLFTPDLEEYSNEIRGFYLDINNNFPTKPVLTTQELIKQIRDIDQYDFESFATKYNPETNKYNKEKIIKLIDDLTGL